MIRCLRYLGKVCQVHECKDTYDWLFFLISEKLGKFKDTNVLVIGCFMPG